jgi:hypothetical protein
LNTEVAEPTFRVERGNRPQRSNVDSHRCVGISDCFCFDFHFLYLKIARQLIGVAGKTSDAAISTLNYDDVKFSPAARNRFSDLTDSPELGLIA